MLSVLDILDLISRYKNYNALLPQIDAKITTLQGYKTKLSQIQEYIKGFKNAPDTTLREKANLYTSSLLNMLNNIDNSISKLKSLKSDIVAHLQSIESNILIKNVLNLGTSYLKYLTPYVSGKIETEYAKIKNNTDLYNKLTDFKLLESYLKNAENNYQDILNLSQEKGLVSATSKIRGFYGEWKNYVKYALIVAGIGVAGFYLKPFIEVAGQSLKKITKDK